MTKKVIVQDGNVEKALRKLKKKVVSDGILQEIQMRQSYVKPTTKKKIAKSLAKKRWQKYLRSQQLPSKGY